MKKAILLVLLLVMALALVPAISRADCAPATPAGTVCEEGGVITADGDATNPDPLDGWAQVDTNTGTVCADDQGSPGDEGGSPTCAP